MASGASSKRYPLVLVDTRRPENSFEVLDQLEVYKQGLIQQGDALVLGLAAANSDPRVHPDDRSIEVGNRAHLAWSTGPHACPARMPARLITRTAVDTALNLLGGVRVTLAAEQITTLPSPWTRCPATLPVSFAPAATPDGDNS